MTSLESQMGGPGAAPRYKQSPLWQRARNSWLGEQVRGFKRFPHELQAWLEPGRVNALSVSDLSRSIAALEAAAAGPLDPAAEAESPIFLLSTGWRAGSTLLQRVLVTDPSLLLWGEPLGEMVFLSRMTEMVSHFISLRNLNEWRNQPPLTSSSLSKQWIANLYPPGEDFRSALRAIFDRWMARPAREHGFARWGFKEVRIAAAEAALLHWLYPRARFLVISRHPFDCYRSLVDSGWQGVYDRYPEVSVDSAAAFARHWNRLAVSWATLPGDFPIVSVKYEDLIARKVDFRGIESWLGIKVNEEAALSAPVGGTATRSRLNWYERMIISREAAPGLRALGYTE